MEDIQALKQEVDVAKKNGLRPELIASLEARLEAVFPSLPPEIPDDLANLDNKGLMKLYKQTKGWLTQHEDEKENFIEYLETLKRIEELEEEGRKRGILYFMPEEEQLKVFKKVFGKEVEFLPPTPVSKANLERVKDG